MKTIYFVTGNENKYREVKNIIGDSFDLQRVDVDTVEIQSASLMEISKAKAKSAYEQTGKPVVVEDVGFYIKALNGFPGPFIKFVEKSMGNGGTIELLGDRENRKAYVRVLALYHDGKEFIVGEGIVNGELTREVREGEGWGFDHTFIPEGHDKTFSEMGLEEKNKISHRKLAFEDLVRKL